jgi:hypothetical protein
VAPRWAALYEALVFQPFRAYDRTAPSRLTTGFSALFPALMLVCFVALWLRRRQRGPEEAAIAFAVLSIVWVFVLVVGVDGVEGNRMRYPTEGLFFLSVLWSARVLGGRLFGWGRRGASRPDLLAPRGPRTEGPSPVARDS